MRIVNWCNKTDGTKLNAYQWMSSLNNSLKYAIEASIDGWNVLARNYELSFPDSKWVIPLVTDGVCALSYMPPKKFWALRVSFNQAEENLPGLSESAAFDFGLSYGFNIPLPKQSIDQLWHALVASIDTTIAGSEYWPFIAEEGDQLVEGEPVIGEWYQGIQYDPVQKFGVLADGPILMRNAAIVISIAAILVKMGLSKTATDFYRRMVERRRYNKQRQEINENESLIRSLNDYVKLHVATKDKLEIVDSKIGLRLFLK